MHLLKVTSLLALLGAAAAWDCIDQQGTSFSESDARRACDNVPPNFSAFDGQTVGSAGNVQVLVTTSCGHTDFYQMQGRCNHLLDLCAASKNTNGGWTSGLSDTADKGSGNSNCKHSSIAIRGF